MLSDQNLLTKSGLIAERLALLKNNGENNWRKRVTKNEITEDVKTESSIDAVSTFD